MPGDAGVQSWLTFRGEVVSAGTGSACRLWPEAHKAMEGMPVKGRRLAAVVVTLLFVFTSLSLVSAQQKTITVGVSWANFQEERWKIDEAAIKAALAKAGARYVSADAQSSNEKQISDVEGLIARGVNALIILAWDKDAVHPAVNKAKAEKIPVIGYDRLIETPGVFYITFDNREVGRMQARGGFKARPKGDHVFIKGSSTDPNADFVHRGQADLLGRAIKKGDIKVVGEQYTDGGRPGAAPPARGRWRWQGGRPSTRSRGRSSSRGPGA